MNGVNKTMISVFYGDEMLFCTDSFPAIPKVREFISVRKDDKSERFVVEAREFIYQSYTDKNDREIYVILRVRKPGFID